MFPMKLISYVVSFSLLFQSCVVYHRAPIALEDAYNGGMVKLVTSDGSKLKYDNLLQKDGVTYGAIGYINDTTNFWHEYIRDEDGKKVLDYIILPSEIKSAHLKNKVVSAALYALPIIALGAGILALIIIVNNDWSIDY